MEKIRKIGLATCFVDNFGACLQAFALQKIINKHNCQCEILKYSPIRSQQFELKYPFLRPLFRFRLFLKSFFSYSYKQEYLRKGKFDFFRKKYLKFSKVKCTNNAAFTTLNEIYDCFVTGSDQIWNPNLFGKANNRFYFLDFVKSDRKRIAYAPSIGVDHISEQCGKEMGEFLDKFSFVSVREEAGKAIINNYSRKECHVVLDPTLLLNKEEWIKELKQPLIKNEYIFCYLFGENPFYIEFVENMRKKLNCEVVIIPLSSLKFKSSYKSIFKIGPIDFVNLISNASLVITDSFHATAFSINLNTPFYCLLRNNSLDLNNMNSRIYNLLKLTSLENRLITKNLDNFSQNIDFSKSNYTLKEKREHDIKLLYNAIDN